MANAFVHRGGKANDATNCALQEASAPAAWACAPAKTTQLAIQFPAVARAIRVGVVFVAIDRVPMDFMAKIV